MTGMIWFQMGGMEGMRWMFGALMMLFWLLLLIALAGGIYWLFTRLFGNNNATESPHPATTEESTQEAIDILNKRYARGEIDEEEYARRKEHLREFQ